MLSLVRALGFLTLLPVGRWGRFEPRDIPAMLAAFPWAGVAIGALLGCAWHGAALFSGPVLAAALAVAAWALLTRGLHLDGLADCADALGGGHTRERRLEIMKDPHVGAFGAIAVVLALVLKTAALSELIPLTLSAQPLDPRARLLPLIAICAAARMALVVGAFRAPAARTESSLGAYFLPGARPFWVLFAALLAGLALAALAGGAAGLASALVAAAGALGLRQLFFKTLGGQTGDTLGATVELCEILALVTYRALQPVRVENDLLRGLLPSIGCI